MTQHTTFLQPEHSERGTGRTYRQLEQLPDGSRFLVHHLAMVDHCHTLMERMNRDPKAISYHIVRVTRDIDNAIRGTSVPFDMDHATRDYLSALGDTMALAVYDAYRGAYHD